MEKIAKVATVDEMKAEAEQEFTEYFGTYPTCAVYAPGSLSLGRKNTNLAESKSLSMAVQLVTVLVGKRSHGSKWCYVKTTAEDVIGSKVFDVYLNRESLEVSVEDSSWVRYVKGTIRCFKDRRAHVPGFKLVIASNVPMKRGLGSSSALVVALYTFLEAITNTYTGNLLEKALACYLAEKLASNLCRVHLADILTSVIGVEDQIFSFDPQSLRIGAHAWNSRDVSLILIECKKPPPTCKTIENKEASTLSMSKWRTDSLIQLLFSPEAIKTVNAVKEENERVEKMARKIESQEWDALGKLMGENHRSVDELKGVEGLLGISVVDRDHGASIVMLVRESKLNSFVSFWKRSKTLANCYVMKACRGASVVYSYERRFLPSRKRRPRFVNKYHLKGEDNVKEYYCRFETAKTIPFFVPHVSYFD